MNVRLFTFLIAAGVLFAADPERLALTLRAQTDFERVFASPAPPLGQAEACIQSEASVLPVATPEELPLVHFRKGWCTLAAAAATSDAHRFSAAAAEFDVAASAWTGREAAVVKKLPPEPLPAALPALAAIARLNAGAADAKGLAVAVESGSCPAAVMPEARCRAVLDTGREWLGWLDLQRGDPGAAARDFPPSSEFWVAWTAGRAAFRDRHYADAAADYRRALAASHEPAALIERLAPQITLADRYAEIGGAELLAGNPARAIATLTDAVKHEPSDAHALYLRGLAENADGRTADAIADFNLAARYALARGEDEGAGEAHLYRGLALYRRREFTKAEDEFTNALNFNITPAKRADAVAWRRLAAVAGGSCQVATGYLEESLPKASPYFPLTEARKALAACRSK